MFGFIFLFFVFLNGHLVSQFFLLKGKLINLILAFVSGSIFSVSIIYLVTSYVTHNLFYSLLIYFLFSIFLFFIRIKKIWSTLFELRSVNYRSVVVVILVFIFSFYLMNKSFSYANGNFLISSNTYLDFGAHIPFVRSFSLGNNFPAEVPFFGNSNLIYHFMFDFYVGIFEYLGLNISLTYNLISGFFFTFLLIIIYRLGETYFKSKAVGLLSVVFFLFTPSISFISFFADQGFSLKSIWNNYLFLLDSPFGKNTISVFWTLNTFTNQRHLIFAMLVVLLFVYLMYLKIGKKMNYSQSVTLGFLIGFLPFWNTQIFLSGIITLIMCLIFIPANRRFYLGILFIASIAATPQILLIIKNSNNSLILNPGFMVANYLTLLSFSKYWFANLGFSLLFFVFGLWKVGRDKRLIFILFLPLFIIPNIFQFTRDIFDNHKFFNLWIISFYFYASFGIVYLFRKSIYFKFLISIILFIILIPGFLNFLVIKNDVKAEIADYQSYAITRFIQEKIPNNKLVLTNGEIYDPASIAGKKTYLGRSHYIFLYGGDPEKRLEVSRAIFKTKNNKYLNQLLMQEEISYIIIYKDAFAKNSVQVDKDQFKNFQLIYEDNKGSIYKI